MEIRFHKRAISDAREIYQYYLAVSQDLGDEFWRELEESLERARQHPSRNHFDSLGVGLRRVNLKKFPVHFLYRVFDDYIRVTTVRHDRRKPSYGTSRR